MQNQENNIAPAPGTASVWWLGQGSFVFEGPHTGPLVVDPYLSNSCGNGGGEGSQRLCPVPVAPGDLKVAAIFLTHDHQDHTDPETLPDLVRANPDVPIYAPLASIEHLGRLGISGPHIHRLERGESVTIAGATVHAVYAEHTEDSVGLVFVFDHGPTIYHTADTEYFDGIGDAAKFAPDFMDICINGRWGNMNADEAVQVTSQIKPREVMPMHWGLFSGNTADPHAFVAKLADAGLDARPVVLKPTGLARHTVTAAERNG